MNPGISRVDGGVEKQVLCRGRTADAGQWPEVFNGLTLPTFVRLLQFMPQSNGTCDFYRSGCAKLATLGNGVRTLGANGKLWCLGVGPAAGAAGHMTGRVVLDHPYPVR